MSSNEEKSVIIPIDDFMERFSELKNQGKFAFGPDFQIRDGQIFAVGITYGWSAEEEAIEEAYSCIEKFMPSGVDPRDVVEIIYDEDSDDCESEYFFGGTVQATPLVFNSNSGYDFRIEFGEDYD